MRLFAGWLGVARPSGGSRMGWAGAVGGGGSARKGVVKASPGGVCADVPAQEVIEDCGTDGLRPDEKMRYEAINCLDVAQADVVSCTCLKLFQIRSNGKSQNLEFFNGMGV